MFQLVLSIFSTNNVMSRVMFGFGRLLVGLRWSPSRRRFYFPKPNITPDLSKYFNTGRILARASSQSISNTESPRALHENTQTRRACSGFFQKLIFFFLVQKSCRFYRRAYVILMDALYKELDEKLTKSERYRTQHILP